MHVHPHTEMEGGGEVEVEREIYVFLHLPCSVASPVGQFQVSPTFGQVLPTQFTDPHTSLLREYPPGSNDLPIP